MDRVIYVDIGTHFGQEYQSIFGNQKYIFYKIFRRAVGYYILRKGKKLPLSEVGRLLRQRRQLRKKRNKFLCFFVEANPKIIQHSNVYKYADGIFNCALTGDQNFSLIDLYLGDGNSLSQGSSIFLSKGNVSESDKVPTLGVPAASFFKSLKNYIESTIGEYSVILRLNCEGVEDDVIYAAHKIFADKLVLVMGSLKDVKGCKGDDAYDALENYLNFNGLPFVFFSSSLNSWLSAHHSISEIC